MKLRHNRTGSTRSRFLDWPLPDDEDRYPEDTGIDALIKDGGHLAYCIRYQLRHLDVTDLLDPASRYLQ